MADELVTLRALRLVWMGDGRPLVQPGEEFETSQEAAFVLVDKGHAAVVEAPPIKAKKTEEAKE